MSGRPRRDTVPPPAFAAALPGRRRNPLQINNKHPISDFLKSINFSLDKSPSFDSNRK
jgi:hypothetical protein